MTVADTPAPHAAGSAFAPKEAVVWAEIPVTDLDAGITFYSKVLGGALDPVEMGPDHTAVIRTDPPMAGTSAHLYKGRPAGDGRGPTIHLVVADTAEAAASRAEEAGGKRLQGPIPIPYGQFIYIEDPDGNSVGLFEPKAQPDAS